ncbi:MAG TPA: DUF134 domain-containing protein [Desulfotomaculum sp.]|nr:DUF134 domain-containing protein [Desulfotomaculum sp.]
MGRPPKCRRVGYVPHCTFFKPAGVPLFNLEEIGLSIEEVEAIRLKDLKGLEQEDCANRMGISRPTFQRILTEARAKVAEALVKGKAIRVEGGNFQLITQLLQCRHCNNEWEEPPESRGAEVCPKCGGAGTRDVTTDPHNHFREKRCRRHYRVKF